MWFVRWVLTVLFAMEQLKLPGEDTGYGECGVGMVCMDFKPYPATQSEMTLTVRILGDDNLFPPG